MHKRFGFYAMALVAVTAWAVETPEDQLKRIEARQDSLDEFVTSTVIGKDDVPVAVSGDMTVRFKHFDYYDRSALQNNDYMRTKVEAALNMGIVASPSSFLTVWSNLYLPFDFSGYFQNSSAFQPNSGDYNHSERVLYLHWTDYYGAKISENMLAGLDVRAGNFGAMAKLGGVIWANSSPLTMWERETSPRFLSQYELFEDERVVSTYYKEKSFKPVKEGGRAFWTNRSFGGALLDVHTLPWNMKAQFMLSQPMDMDIGTRDGLRMLGGQPGELEMVGTYDFRGMVYHGRLAKEKIQIASSDVTIGLNYLGVKFDRGIIYEPEYSFKDAAKNPYIVDNHVASFDFKGNLTSKFYLMADVALSWDDSTLFKRVEDATISANYEKDFYKSETSTPEVGVYVKAQSKHWEPITLEAVYLPKDFYSPYSMTNPSRFLSWRQDEFSLGAGTFRYTPNLVGGNLKLEPEFNRGRFDIQYGIHRQLEAGDDIMNFKYNLNGRAMWESSNSWTKHKTLFAMDSGNVSGSARHLGRVAGSNSNKQNNQVGGVRGGTWELWESVGIFENAEDAANDSVTQHVKWNSTVAIDAGYDIGHWFNTDRNIMMAIYASVSGVSTAFAPLAYSESQSDMLMWSLYTQAEPAVALTSTLHGFLILGFETFRASDTYVRRSVASALPSNGTVWNAIYSKGAYYYEKAPMNIVQTALGFGFDWDFTARAGLHLRYKWMTNSDETLPENDWKGHYIQAETKMWF